MEIITRRITLKIPSPRGKLPGVWAAAPFIGILAITGLESYALSQGIDGTALTAALTAIAALGGAGLGRLFK